MTDHDHLPAGGKRRQPPSPRPRREVPNTTAAIQAAMSASAAPVTSLAMAARHTVDAGNYRAAEREAAQQAPALAMDYGLNRNAVDALSFVEATGWPGFQTLAMLAQLPEYRAMHETLADETVRTWGEVQSSSEDPDADEKLERIREEFERLGVRNLVRAAVIHDQAFGGAHILPRIEDKTGSPLPSDAPLLLSKAFVAKGSLKSLATVEPLWVSPAAYNANDPTARDFYKPSSWMMLGTRVDASRVYTLVSRPVSDLLKPAYSFRGVSMSQLAMPYVDNWLRTRQSVSDTVKQFSVTYLLTDLSQLLAPGGQQSLHDRMTLFNLNRDNRNLAVVDRETEEFAQINTPLSGLDALQAQAQEQMSAVSHIPLVKLLGITPAGLNANSDGEIRVWYDFVAGYQSHNLTPLMNWLLQLVQLSLFGEIDPALRWDWSPLFELNDLELADVRQKNADTELRYMEAGVLSGEMIQKRLQLDPNSGYSGILAELDPEAEAAALTERMLGAAAQNTEPTGEGADSADADPEA